MNNDTYVGIDWGRGKANIDPETKIRFGVIPENDVLQAWADSAEPYYGNKEVPDDDDLGYDEPYSYYYEGDGFFAECTCGQGDIFISKSPYFTYAQFCSPCAPGACHLRNPINENFKNNRCYCFGHDWFEDGVAPYKVYLVKTGEEVKP